MTNKKIKVEVFSAQKYNEKDNYPYPTILNVF